MNRSIQLDNWKIKYLEVKRNRLYKYVRFNNLRVVRHVLNANHYTHEDKSAFMRCNTCRYVVIFGRKDKKNWVTKNHVSITYLYGGK